MSVYGARALLKLQPDLIRQILLAMQVSFWKARGCTHFEHRVHRAHPSILYIVYIVQINAPCTSVLILLAMQMHPLIFAM